LRDYRRVGVEVAENEGALYCLLRLVVLMLSIFQEFFLDVLRKGSATDDGVADRVLDVLGDTLAEVVVTLCGSLGDVVLHLLFTLVFA